MGRIVISGLRQMGIHGVLPEEQHQPQPFEVDLVLDVDLDLAARSDALEDTVDYGAVVDAVSRIIAEEHFQLLERLAARIAEVTRSDPRVRGVRVAVRKLHPPVGALVDHVGVELDVGAVVEA